MDADKIETRLLEPWSHRPEFGFKTTSMEDYEAVVREAAVIITAQAAQIEELVGALEKAERILSSHGYETDYATATLSRVKQAG